MAAAARAAGIPMIISAASLLPLEEIAARNPDAWYQGCLSAGKAATLATLDRVGGGARAWAPSS